jgi:hypothetical protein
MTLIGQIDFKIAGLGILLFGGTRVASTLMQEYRMI